MTQGDFFDDLFSDTPTAAASPRAAATPQRKPTMQEFTSYLPDGTAYRPYDRLIRLNQGERSGGIADQMLLEAGKLKAAGYTDVYRQFNLLKEFEQTRTTGIAALVGLGKALQPLAAPQQAAFGTIKGLTSLAQGKNPGEDLKRGWSAATGFLTYGLVLGNTRDKAVSGKDITQQWGMTGRTASVTGGLMDFFADPLLFGGVLGAVGKAGRTGRLGNALLPRAGESAALREVESIYGGAARGTRAGDALQSLTSITDVVNNVATGAIKNPAQFRRALGEIVQNPTKTTYTLPGLVDDEAIVGGSPSKWGTLREQIDLAAGMQSILSTVNAVARIGISPAPLKQAWQAVPLGARMKLGEAAGSAIEAARFNPLGFGAAGSDTMTMAEQLISRWGTVAGIPEVNIKSLIENGRTQGAGISRKLQDRFRQRQIEAANVAMRAIDVTARYQQLTRKMDVDDKKYFDYLSTKVLDWQDPADLMSHYDAFTSMTERHGITPQATDFLRRVADYDVYGARIRQRIGLEDEYGYQEYQQGLDLLTHLVTGERGQAEDLINRWLDFRVNPEFSNVLVRYDAQGRPIPALGTTTKNKLGERVPLKTTTHDRKGQPIPFAPTPRDPRFTAPTDPLGSVQTTERYNSNAPVVGNTPNTKATQTSTDSYNKAIMSLPTPRGNREAAYGGEAFSPAKVTGKPTTSPAYQVRMTTHDAPDASPPSEFVEISKGYRSFKPISLTPGKDGAAPDITNQVGRVRSMLENQKAAYDAGEITPDTAPAYLPTKVVNGERQFAGEMNPELYLHSDNQLYVVNNDVAYPVLMRGTDPYILTGPRSRPTELVEGTTPVDDTLAMNAGSAEAFTAFGANRFDDEFLAEGFSTGGLDEELARMQEIKAGIGQKTPIPDEELAQVRMAQDNDIFSSRHVSQIRALYPDELPKGSPLYPSNNPENFKNPDGTLNTQAIENAEINNPGWQLYKPLPKNHTYEGDIVFHAGNPPRSNVANDGDPIDFTGGRTNLASHGIYTTDAVQMAGTYMGKNGETKLYALRLGKIKAFDLDKPPADTKSVIRLMEASLRARFPEGSAGRVMSDTYIRGLRAMNDDPNETALFSQFDTEEPMMFGRDALKGEGAEFYDPQRPDVTRVRDGNGALVDGRQFTSSEKGQVADAIAESFTRALRARGYDAVRHVGGLRAGGNDFLHNVLILINPDKKASQMGAFNRLGDRMETGGRITDKMRPTEPRTFDPTYMQQTAVNGRGGFTLEVQRPGKGITGPLSGVKSTEGTQLMLRASADSFTINRTRMREGLAEAYRKGYTRTVSQETGDAQQLAAIESAVDSIPGATLIRESENYRPVSPDRTSADGLTGEWGQSEKITYHIELDERLIADPDALFRPNAYDKNFNAQDETAAFAGETPGKAGYGRVVSPEENPFSVVPRDPNAWNPNERNNARLHLRRKFLSSENPEEVIQRVLKNAEPARVTFDEERLRKVMLRALIRTNRKDDVTEFTQDFMKAWDDPDLAPADYVTAFFQNKQFSDTEIRDVMNDIGADFWGNAGISWRPPNEELAQQLHTYLTGNDRLSAGGAQVMLGTSRAAEKSRKDLPDYWKAALDQIFDLEEVITESSRINQKLISRRGMVQDMYDFLVKEGGLIPSGEAISRLGGNRQGWRVITAEQAGALKAMRDAEGTISDTPFKEGDMLPAAYHRALTAAVTEKDPNVLMSAVQWLNAKWKQHKVASPAAIVRDSASNFVLASQAGIQPIQLAAYMGHYFDMVNQAKKIGGGMVDLIDEKVQFTLPSGVKTSMQEIMESSDFLHAGFFFKEVSEPLSNLSRQLRNPNGNGFQQTVSALTEFSKRTASVRDSLPGKLAAGGADLMGFGGPITKFLGDTKGMVDASYKGAVYLMKRNEGMNPAEAAKFADDLFFNYENVPYTVDFLRRNGIAPFATFQFLSAGRFIKNLYENPYAVQRMYRLPGIVRESFEDESEYDKERRASPGYVRDALWAPAIGPDGKFLRDGQGRSQWLAIGPMLPETALGESMLQGPGGMFSAVSSPSFDLVSSIITGQGYKGQSVYMQGMTPDELTKLGERGTKEWAVGVTRLLWQYGVVPWAPGTPMSKRLGESIEASLVPHEVIGPKGGRQFAQHVSDSLGQRIALGAADLLQKGPAVIAAETLTPGDAYDLKPTSELQQPPQDMRLVIGRYFGLTSEVVQPDIGQPGSQRSNVIGLRTQMKAVQKAMVDQMNRAKTQAERDKIQADYQKMMDRLMLNMDVQMQP